MTDVTQGTAGQTKAGFYAAATEARKKKTVAPAKPLNAQEKEAAAAQRARNISRVSTLQNTSGF